MPRAEQAYPVIATRIDRRTEEYRANEVSNRAAIDKLSAALAQATVGGGDKYTSRHKAAGKLLPRERVELLLDRDSYFLELCPLAGKDLPGHTPGASLVGGIGLVSGVECLITASESTVKGGAISEASAWKSGRLSEIAEQNRLPSISMIESAGADLPNQSKIFVPGGRGFRDLTRRSEQRIPTICLVFGSSTAGGAYFPGMSDYVVMVEKQAQVYLAGPPLVKMATGEESDHEELGGAEMHARISGVADYLANDEPDASRIGREARKLHRNKLTPLALNRMREFRNSLVPTGDMMHARRWVSVTVQPPSMEKACWTKKDELKAVCAPGGWPQAGAGGQVAR